MARSRFLSRADDVKPRKRELSTLRTAHCLDKIHIFMKFRHHIPGSDVVAYKQHFAKDRQFDS